MAVFFPPLRLTALGLCMASAGVAAQTLDDVVITVNRVEQRAFDTAASVTLIGRDAVQEGQAQANLSEPLARVPGLFALNRQNYAQDVLISSRGFGANSAFGARGIKIYVDGIPGTVADGQGQISHIDLASTERIEVLRGPFSVLYGNSAGGVIHIFTERAKPGTEITPYAETGSFGLRKYGVKLTGEQGTLNYLLDAGHLHTDGYRQHSRTDRDNQNARLGLQVSPDTHLQIVANKLSLDAQDPLGLTAAQWQKDPTQAGTNALVYDSRKSVDQAQLGLGWSQRLDGQNHIDFTPYYGQRKTRQYQAGSAAAVNGVYAAAANGVIDLSREFYGMDAKWTRKSQLHTMPLLFVGGIDSNWVNDHRLTFNNNAGGVAAAATASNQDFDQTAHNLDVYAQAELRPSEQWSLSGGARRSQTKLGSVSNNAATSPGSNTYNATTGVLSAQYDLNERSNLYLAYGSGFDTPTLNQIAYSTAFVRSPAAGNTGNIGLQAATTKQWELGLKSKLGTGLAAQVAWFSADTRNDILVSASNAGRTAYTNAPQTKRQGIELSAQAEWAGRWQANLAYTRLNAQVAQDYTSYQGSTAVVIRSGNRIPGVPGQGVFGELLWRQPDKAWEAALETRAVTDMVANDTNTAQTNAYALVNARVVARQQYRAWRVTEFARIDNLFNRSYVGSVIVNQANSQFYEPAPGRNWVLGVKASLLF